MQKFNLLTTLERALTSYRSTCDLPEAKMPITINGHDYLLAHVSTDHVVCEDPFCAPDMTVLIDRSHLDTVIY